jgi:protein-S-isoprenylcysteine O-methyltransferase Ste14
MAGSCWVRGTRIGGISAMAITASRAYGFIQTALLCVFAAAVFFGPAAPLLLTGRAPRLIGDVFCFAGLFLLFGGINRLGRAIQVDPAPRSDATLVTAGIYKWFRHPIYTAIVVIVIGIFLRRPTIAVAIAAAIVIVFLAIKVRFEEKLLMARYPDYSNYKQRSWGLLPGPRWPSRSS